jgi:hypothetical protein
VLKALVDIHTYCAYGRFALAGALRETNPQVNTTDPTISTYPTIAALGQILIVAQSNSQPPVLSKA